MGLPEETVHTISNYSLLNPNMLGTIDEMLCCDVRKLLILQRSGVDCGGSKLLEEIELGIFTTNES